MINWFTYEQSIYTTNVHTGIGTGFRFTVRWLSALDIAWASSPIYRRGCAQCIYFQVPHFANRAYVQSVSIRNSALTIQTLKRVALVVRLWIYSSIIPHVRANVETIFLWTRIRVVSHSTRITALTALINALNNDAICMTEIGTLGWSEVQLTVAEIYEHECETQPTHLNLPVTLSASTRANMSVDVWVLRRSIHLWYEQVIVFKQ